MMIRCRCCGLPEAEHHDFEPQMPAGCVCSDGEWTDDVPDPCPEYVGNGGNCTRCEHDAECHKTPNDRAKPAL